MKWIALAIVFVGVVVLVIGWRATQHPSQRDEFCRTHVGNLSCMLGK